MKKQYSLISLLKLSALIFFSAMPVWADSTQPKLAIIIDDIGYNLSNGRKIAQLPLNLTLAVLPFTPHGKVLAELGHQTGKEIMLHAPMSNEHKLPLGPGGLTNNVSQSLLIETLDKNLSNIPHVKGLNNHMGSRLTQNIQVMGWLMEYLKARQLYFVDSRTTAKTEALNQAQLHQLPSRKRDVFLDDKRNIDHIRQQLKLAIRIAQKQGTAIAIGHPYPETLRVLNELADQKPLPIELVFVSNLLPHTTPIPTEETPYFCPIDTQYPENQSITPTFVTEQYLKLPSRSHKNVIFVIKKI